MQNSLMCYDILKIKTKHDTNAVCGTNSTYLTRELSKNVYSGLNVVEFCPVISCLQSLNLLISRRVICKRAV